MSTYPYFRLQREDQSAINQALQRDYADSTTLAQDFTAANQFMRGILKEQPSGGAQKILKDLNARAQRLVTDWKDEQTTIRDVSAFIRPGFFIKFASVAIPTGLALVYARSHRFFAVANLCVAIAHYHLAKACIFWSITFEWCNKHVEYLTFENHNEFSGKVDNVYNELKKASFVMRTYLNAHPKKMGKELLKEQLCALSLLQAFLKRFRLSNAPFVMDGAEAVGVEQVQLFFQKFEKLCKKGMIGTTGVGLFAAAWMYNAYVQRARLMVVAGMVVFLGALKMTHELFVIQKGSRKIHLASEKHMAQEFKIMALCSSILAKSGYQNGQEGVHKVFVLRFDDMLKLIPSWNAK